MVDIQNSFFLHWAERLWREDSENWKVIPHFLFSRLGGIHAFASNVSSKNFKGLYLIKNVFWEKVLSTWLDHNYPNHENTNHLHV